MAFANFVAYRDLGPRRSLAKAAKDTGKGKATLEQQSTKNKWVERTEAYDDMMDLRFRQEREGELLRAERQEAQLGRTMTTLAARRILGAPAQGGQAAVEAINPGDLDPMDAAKLAEAGIKIRRLAQGQPTDILRGTFGVSSQDLQQAVRGVYEILMRFVPEERQPRAASAVQLFFETGRME